MLIPVLVITIIGISSEGEDRHTRVCPLVIFVQNGNKASSHNTLLTMVHVLVVLIITAGLLMWERIRSDVVVLCSMLALVLMGIIILLLRGTVQFHGLREGRPTSPGNRPGGDGMADPSDLPAMRSRAVSTLALRSIGILSAPLSTKR